MSRVSAVQVVVPDNVSEEVAATVLIGTLTVLGLVQTSAVSRVRLLR